LPPIIAAIKGRFNAVEKMPECLDLFEEMVGAVRFELTTF
jgi:hypothetical protein